MAIAIMGSSANAVAQPSKTLYRLNADCVIDGKAGKDVAPSYILHQAKALSAGCYRPPQTTPEDMRNPLIGKNVQWSSAGIDGTVIEYIGASNEVVISRCPDGKIFRIGASGLSPKETTCRMNK